MKSVAAVLLMCAGVAAAGVTVTPGVWDAYQGGIVLIKNLPTEAACAAALDARKKANTFTCRTRTTVTVTVTQTCPAKPADETQSVACPVGTTGTWSQTRAYISAPFPTCWTAGAYSPASAPAGSCTIVSVPNEVTHGQPFTVPGTGYGTRVVEADVFDDCSGSSIYSVWPQSLNSPSACTAPIRGVATPYPDSHAYIALNLKTGLFGARWIGKQVANAKGQKVFMRVYRRSDPAWVYADDNNTKYATVAVGTTAFDGAYWYHDQTPVKSSLNSSWGDSFYSSGGLGSLRFQPGSSGGVNAQNTDPWFGWVAFEYRFELSSNARIKFLFNNVLRGNGSGLNSDSNSGTARTFSFGMFSRAAQTQANDFHYLTDAQLVVGKDAWKRVMLANNPVYTAATITEPQPIVSWNDTIVVRGNKGRLPAGVAFVHVFDENDVGTLAGQVTVH